MLYVQHYQTQVIYLVITCRINTEIYIDFILEFNWVVFQIRKHFGPRSSKRK